MKEYTTIKGFVFELIQICIATCPAIFLSNFVWRWLIYGYQVFIVFIMAFAIIDDVRYPMPKMKLKRIIGAIYHFSFLLAWLCFGKKECLNVFFVIAVLICMLMCLFSSPYNEQEQQFVRDKLNKIAEEKQQKKAAQSKQVHSTPAKDDFELTDDNIMEYLMIKEIDKRYR